MKRVDVVRAEGLEIIPFDLNRYLDGLTASTYEKISKKKVRAMADELGLGYDESHIVFAKKLLSAYLKRQR